MKLALRLVGQNKYFNMAKKDGLPLWELKLDSQDPDSHIEWLSLVDRPAVEKDFVAFAKNKKLYHAVTDKMEIVGPAMIPGLQIYRNDTELGEFYVTYSAETVDAVQHRFMKEQRTLGVNYMHQPNSQVNDVVIVESWIIQDNKNDKANLYGFTDLPVGTWMVRMKFSDAKFWEDEVASGNVRGISIEGMLDMEIKNFINKKKQDMATKSKLKQDSLNLKMDSHPQAEGYGDVFIDGEIAIGNMVFSNYHNVTLVNGVKTVTQYPVWCDMVELADGTVLTLKDAKIILIDKNPAPVAQSKINKTKDTKMKKFDIKMLDVVTTDGVTLKTTADTWAVDADVVTVASDNTETPAADGDYTLEDGTVISVASGKVSKIVEPAGDEMATIEQAKADLGITALENTMTAILTKLDSMATTMSKIPGANVSVDHKNDNKKDEKKDEKDLKFERTANFLKSLAKK